MAWDRDEIPAEILRERIQRLQAAMSVAGHDALILYTNFIRSAAVSYLTAFSPYWADGMLLVPLTGEPIFATTLSKRVGTWIQSVKPIGDLVNSPTPGTVLGQRLASDASVRRIAILEHDSFPSGLYNELSAALPGVEIVDGTEAYHSARLHLDPIERKLLEATARIAAGALASLRVEDASTVGFAVGAVEQYARLQGAEEVYVAIAPDMNADRRFIRLSGTRPLGRRFAVRATVAYKGNWVRAIKTYSRDEADLLAFARAESWFRSFTARIDRTGNLQDQITNAVAQLPGAQIESCFAESALGTRPLALIGSSEIPPAMTLTVNLRIGGIPWSIAGLALLPRESVA